MDAAIVDQITRDMIAYQLPSMSVIFAGVDERGTHIYVVEDNELRCNDGVGFAAIGSGARHAETQLSLAGHAWNSPNYHALLLTYMAKKRAELAPGVGKLTDLFVIGPGLGMSAAIHTNLVKKVDVEYRKIKKSEERALRSSMNEMEKFYDKNFNPARIKPDQTAPQFDGPKEIIGGPANGTANE